MDDPEKMEAGETPIPAAEASVSESSASGRRKRNKRKLDVEPRTPLKRQRVPVEKYQSPLYLEEGPTKPKVTKEEIAVHYKKGSFLAVRGDAGSFYLCKTAQNVYSCTRKFKINWLNLDAPPNIYKIDFLDQTEIECVLTNLKMEKIAKDTYRLPHDEESRIDTILLKSIKKERGEPVDDLIPQVQELEIIKPSPLKAPPEKKPRRSLSSPEQNKTKPTPKARASLKAVKSSKLKTMKVNLRKGRGTDTGSDIDKQLKTKKKRKIEKVIEKVAKIKTKKAELKEKKKDSEKKKDLEKKKGVEKKKGAEKKDEKPVKTKGPDRQLRPNPKIKVLEKDPFFETKENVPFISKTVHGKLSIRAVLLNDMQLLRGLLENKDQVWDINNRRSVANPADCLTYALKLDSQEAIKVLIKDIYTSCIERKGTGINRTPTCLLQSMDTSRCNPKSLGFNNIGAVLATRGSREGNNAFLKSAEWQVKDDRDYYEECLKLGVSYEALQMVLGDTNREYELTNRVLNRIEVALSHGHRKLAGKLIEECCKRGGFGYSFLHYMVLLNDEEDLKDDIHPSAVRKKPTDNSGITPIHCAAINPNVIYLMRLLSIEPNTNIPDRAQRLPIHYAAVCKGSGPLQYLLGRGCSLDDVDSLGFTPLHHACLVGQAENVELVLKKAKPLQSAASDLNPAVLKWGAGGLNRPNKSSLCPLHLAITGGHIGCVRTLLKYGANVNIQTSAKDNKLTPLMLAAAYGHLDIARELVKSGATVEQTDTLKRTALMHAAMNGCTHVVSYLLNLGADGKHIDSSGNTVLHYAAAYGWYFCVKLLIDHAGGDPKQLNNCKLSPVSVAFLKGHMGLMDFLLSQPGVNVNFQNDEGVTLVSQACGSALVEGLHEQLVYLITEKGANPAISDLEGKSALHHLAGHQISDIDREKMYTSTSLMCAELLVETGCNPSVRDCHGKTAVMIAIEQGNADLAKLLVEKGGEVTADKDENGKNILHLMAERSGKNATCKMGSILDYLVRHCAKKSKLQKLKNRVEDKMEVDGEINGDVKHPENFVADKKAESTDMASTDKIFQKMSAEIDYEGYTPLLRACQVYVELEPSWPLEEQQDICKQQNIRDFIKALIELAGANVSQTVQKKRFDVVRPEKDDHHYGPKGKYSAVHFMAEAVHEKEVQERGTKVLCPGMAAILQCKPDLELCSLEGRTPLCLAVSQNRPKMVEMLIKSGANPNVTVRLNQKTEESELEQVTEEVTPLLMAAKQGQLEMVKMLVTAGAKVDVRNSRTEETPLHLVVEHRGNEGRVKEMADVLLKAGAAINAEDIRKRTPLHVAVNANPGLANSSTILEEFLLEHGASVAAKDIRGRMPLHYAFVKQGSHFDNSALDPVDLCRVLTDQMDEEQIDECDAFGQTSLHRAAYRGATVCCSHLIERKADVSLKTSNGNTPLSIAVTCEHDSCAILLIQKGANVADSIVVPPSRREKTDKDRKKKHVWQWKPLSYKKAEATQTYPILQGAVAAELQGVARMVLDTAGIDSRAVECALSVSKYHMALRLLRRITEREKLVKVNDKGQNLFHILMLKTSPQENAELQMEVAIALLERGVPVNQVDNFGCSPIMYAALQHQPSVLAEFLIDNDKTLDISRKDKFGRTVVACYFWKFFNSKWDEGNEWLKILKTRKANFDTLYKYPVRVENFATFMEEAVPDFFYDGGDAAISPLIHAIYNSDFGCAKFLLQNGASPNFTDSRRLTPLMHTVKMNDLNMVKLLLDHDFDPKAVEKDKKPPRKSVSKKFHSRRVFVVKPDQLVPIPVAVDEENKSQDEKTESDKVSKEVIVDGDLNGTDDLEESELDDNEGDWNTDIVETEEEDILYKPSASLPTTAQLQTKIFLRRQATALALQEDYPLVQKTSSVDLSVLDSHGWNVVHHLVCPLRSGTFDNEEMLCVLVKAGADMTVKDKTELSPLDHALISGSPKVAQRLQKFSGIDPEKTEKPTYNPVDVDDGILASSPPINYEADAEAILKKMGESAEVNGVDTLKVLPDLHCEFRKSGEILEDTENDITYDVLLSKVDVSYGIYGIYNFYKMQIVHDKTKDIYVLFTRWGRIGDEGQVQHMPFGTKSEAISEFCKIFRSKTGNYWSSVIKFEDQPKKYRLAPKENVRKRLPKIKWNLKCDLPSKLPQPAQDLLKELINVNLMKAAMKRARVDEDLMPFGCIRKEALLEGRRVLQKLKNLVAELGKVDALSSIATDYQQVFQQISYLSNEFFQLVPQSGYRYERVGPLDTESMLRQQEQFLTSLLDLEVAGKILLGAQHCIKDMNPLDYVYRAMGCCIQLMTEEEAEAQYILKYIMNSSDAKVQAIYRVSRPEADDRQRLLDLDNHMLLWYGSEVANFISLLHRGLQNSPVAAGVNGQQCGEGIYLSDMFSQCRNYCDSSSGVELALLCEVALGKCKEVKLGNVSDIADTDYNSMKVRGREKPTPDWNVTLPYGAVMPLGGVEFSYKPRLYSNTNEYIVTDPAQVCLRYLVLFASRSDCSSGDMDSLSSY